MTHPFQPTHRSKGAKYPRHTDTSGDTERYSVGPEHMAEIREARAARKRERERKREEARGER